MYRTCMSHVNVMKKVRWEEIEMCAIFGGKKFLVGQVEASRVGGCCSVRKGGRPGVWLF